MDILPRGDVFREKYEMLEKIGAGAFGKVFSVKNKSNKEVFAAKYIKTRSSRDKENSEREISLWKNLRILQKSVLSQSTFMVVNCLRELLMIQQGCLNLTVASS